MKETNWIILEHQDLDYIQSLGAKVPIVTNNQLGGAVIVFGHLYVDIMEGLYGDMSLEYSEINNGPDVYGPLFY